MAPAPTRQPGTRDLYTKLIEVAQSIEKIEKKGYNERFKYQYVKSSDMIQAIRGGLFERGILLHGSLENVELQSHGTTSGGGMMILARVRVKWTFTDSTSGELLEAMWEGWGVDTQDKAIYKAYTGCLKTFLEKTFLVPTEDDPEREDATQGQRPKPARAAGAPATSASAGGKADPRTPNTGSPNQRRFFAELKEACQEGALDVELMLKNEVGTSARRRLRADALNYADAQDLPERMTEAQWGQCADFIVAVRRDWRANDDTPPPNMIGDEPPY